MKKNIIKKIKHIYFSILFAAVSFLKFVSVVKAADEGTGDGEAGGGPVRDIKGLIGVIEKIIKESVIPLLVTLAVFYFIWGVVKYIQNAGDEEKRKEGAKMMTYGIIALFVIIAMWGLVNVLMGTFNLETSAPEPPQFP